MFQASELLSLRKHISCINEMEALMCGAIKTKPSVLSQCSVKSSRRICGCSFYALFQNYIRGRHKKAEFNVGRLILKAEEVSKHYNTSRA